ncbi:unnamed protein product, partial [Mesorhabditis belari]|uniref:Uncharacterized protein n=1 Tax=Mesorhabditis belari TaxID=2138241 RepID=A0AAF3J432_9BILA
MLLEKLVNLLHAVSILQNFENESTTSILPIAKDIVHPRYCAESDELTYWFPCHNEKRTIDNQTWHNGCYFGRGAIQSTRHVVDTPQASSNSLIH